MGELLPFLVFICIIVGRKVYKFNKMKREHNMNRIFNSLVELRNGSVYIEEYNDIIENVFENKKKFLCTIENSELPENEKGLAISYLYKKFPQEMEKEQLGILAHKEIFANIAGGIAFTIVASIFIFLDPLDIEFIYKVIIAVGANVFFKGIVSFVFDILSFRKLNPADKEKEKESKNAEKRNPIDFFCDVMENLLVSK